jgi:hypothetical protein
VQVVRAVEQRRHVGGDEHRRVADRLHEPHGRAREVAGDDLEALGDRPELGRRHLLAETGEADEVGERDADVAGGGQRPGSALVGPERLEADRVTEVEAQHLLEHRAEHRHDRRPALGEALRELGLARPRLERELEADRPQRLGGLRHPAAEDADRAQHLLVAHAGGPEGGGGADRLDVEVGEGDRVRVGHGKTVRAAHRIEQLEGHAGLVGDVAAAVPRRAVEEPLGKEEDEQPVGHRGAQLVERGALRLEPLEELDPRRAILAVESVEQTLGGEVHPHRR